MNKIYKIFLNLFKNRLRAILVIATIIIIGVIVSRFVNRKKQSVQIQTQTVERGTIVSSVSASGQVLVSNVVNITTSAKGLVNKMYVKDGDRVISGQKIMGITLDSDGKQSAASAYSSYLSAKLSLDSAKVTLWTLDSAMWAANRTFVNDALARGLLNYDPTYIQENDNWLAAEAKYKNQQAVIAQAERAVTNAWLSYQAVSPIVYAPMSGVITNITYSSGMTQSSSTAQRVAVIKLEGTPLASFNISEIDVSKVKPGQKATVKLDSIIDKTFTGKVVTVDRIGTVTSGVTNYPVVIKFDTDALEILPNMSATAFIILEAKDNVLLMPSSAIQELNEQSVVRVLKGKQEQTVNVETGLVSDSQTEIVSGLSEGDEVVISTVTSDNQSGRSAFGTSGFGGGAGRMFIGR